MPYSTPPTVTVDALVALYLLQAAANDVHCVEARKDRVKTLTMFATACGGLDVDSIKAYHLQDFILSHPTWKSVSTKRAKCNMVRAVFEWAAIEERIARNPFKRVRYDEAPRRPDMDDESFELLCKYANKPFERALRFLRYTACRLGELCNAAWDQIVIEKGIWLIPKHKSQKRTGKPKCIALIPEAIDLLNRIPRDHEKVFLNTAGTPWNRITLGRQFSRMRTRYGLATRASLHGIRHRAASAAIDAGASLDLVSEQLGHSSTLVTQRYYWHKSEETLNGMRKAIQAGIKSAIPEG